MSHYLKNSMPTEVLATSSAVTNPVSNQLAANSSHTSTATNSHLEPAIQMALPHVKAGNYERALSVLASGGSSPQVQNARGVCLMRLGRYEDAVRLYRGLVLHAGGTWSRADVPTVFKTNFATALLLAGHASGCYSLLGEIDNESLPAVVRLRQAIKRWQTTLSFSQRLNWWFGRIDPPHCHVSIDYLPGDFADEPTLPEGETVLPMSAYPPTLEQR